MHRLGKIGAVAFTAILVCSCKTITCPPDKRPVFRERRCDKAYSNHVRDFELVASTAVKRLAKVAGFEIRISNKASSLSEKLTQTTVQFRSTLLSLCQQSSQDPCNQNLQGRILDGTILLHRL